MSTGAARQLATTVNPGLGDSGDVCARGGGNAFFVADLALTGGRVSGGLADVVRTRVARLDECARMAIDAASTVDGAFDLDLLAAMLACTPEEAELAIEPALKAGLVAGPGSGPCGYAFEHEVVREVLRCDLPAAVRTSCRRAADQLQGVRRAQVSVQHARGASHEADETGAVVVRTDSRGATLPARYARSPKASTSARAS